VIQIIGYAADEQTFNDLAKQAESRFISLHQLYDIYHTYPGITNLKSINDQAGLAPVKVDRQIIDLLSLYQTQDHLSPGTVNVALGPVLAVWHDYRTEALDGGTVALPAESELRQAERLCDPAKVIIDPNANTVYLAEKGMRLDVGAVAKGFATEIVARELIAAGLTSGIISAGGSNVRLIGQPADGRETWQVGLQNPDANPLIPDEQPLDVVLANDQSIVTSGDYQRYYEVDGVTYHHLIDPLTLQPAQYYRFVTIMTPDSGLADYLSTTVFLLPFEKGRQLVEQLPDCEAYWMFKDGHVEMTEGMKAHLQSLQEPAKPADG
jgi:thiamine biosynthesis lipoprotein